MDIQLILLQAGLTAVMLAGLLLTLVGLPGNLLILLAALFFGWREEFAHLTPFVLGALAIAWLGGELLDFAAGIGGAKKERASWAATAAAVIGAIGGGILGTGMMPLIGTLAGALLGGFAASYGVEYWLSGDAVKARKVAGGVLKGQLLGMIVKSAVGLGMALTVWYALWR